MGIIELLLIAIGLSMDAVAVSVSNCMTLKNMRKRDALQFGIFFGVFQAIMPLIGWLAGKSFSHYVVAIDHWIAFALLSFIGVKMFCGAFEEKEESSCPSLNFKVLIILAIATSIDALAVGITFAFMQIAIIKSVLIIGLTTFILSVAGSLIGRKAGSCLNFPAEKIGGVLLIGIGVKILIEHLFFH